MRLRRAEGGIAAMESDRALARDRVAALVKKPGFAAFDSALKEYPAIGNQGLSFASSPGKSDAVLEYWPPGEEGAPDYPRPRGIPIDRVGIEAINPNMRPIDVLGDVVSHGMAESDPTIKGYYDRFVSSMTPRQIGILKEQYEYSRANFGEDRPFSEWASMTGLPSYFRGYAFEQWPDDAALEMYTPEQLRMFDEMMGVLRGSTYAAGAPRRAEGGIAAANVGVRPGNRYPRKPKQDDSPGVLRKIASGIAAPFEQMFAVSQGDYAPLGVEWVDGEGWVQSPEKAIPFAMDVAGLATTGALGVPAVPGAAGMGIRAYHGSPHDFDRFSMEKIGTGEGAQAYGHGLYFAEHEGVARGYRDSLAGNISIDGKPLHVNNRKVGTTGDPEVDDLLIAHDGDIEAAIANADPHEAAKLEPFRGRVSADNTGRMYEVDINASPDEFLDWDKPLSEQSPKVREVLEGMGINTKPQRVWTVKQTPKGWTVYDQWGQSAGTFKSEDAARAKAASGTSSADSMGGMYAYTQMGGNPAYSHLDKGSASEALRAAGIKGIRYKDAGSRKLPSTPATDAAQEWLRDAGGNIDTALTAFDAYVNSSVPAHLRDSSLDDIRKAIAAGGVPEQQTHNYVVFDDSTINILKKYGLAGLTAGGAGAAMLGGSDPASASQPTYTTGGKFAAGGRTPRMATGGIADATPMRVTVQKGDNPSKIAKRILGAGASGTEVQALANAIVAANGIKNDRRIQIGDSLIIPGQSAPEVDMPTPRTRASGIAAQANASYRPEAGKPTGLSANPRRDAMAKGLAGIGAPAKNDAGWAPYFQMTRNMNRREAIANEVDQRMRDANLMDNPAPGMKGRPFTPPYSGMPAIDTMRVSPSMSVAVKENMDIGTRPNADIPKTFSQVSGLPDMNAGKFPPDYVPGLLPLQNVPTKGKSPAQLSLGAMPGSIENTASRFAEPPKRSLPDGATTGEHFTDDRPLFMPGVSSSLGHGLIKSVVPGRTDQLPLTVPKDSYIVPADVISGLGQGNTDAGWPLLKRILAARGADIDEGAPVNDGGVEIIAAGGEGVIHPEVITALGGGDVRRGHRLLDDIVLSVRKQTAKRLQALPGPKK